MSSFFDMMSAAIYAILVQNLVSLIDNFMVAGLGDIKMSGVNICGQFNFVFIILINTLCMSGGIFMSQFKGADDKSGMQQSFRFKLLFTGLCGIAYTGLCFAAPQNMFSLLLKGNADATEIIAQSALYSKAVALSWIFMCMSQSIASSLREIEAHACGKSVRQSAHVKLMKSALLRRTEGTERGKIIAQFLSGGSLNALMKLSQDEDTVTALVIKNYECSGSYTIYSKLKELYLTKPSLRPAMQAHDLKQYNTSHRDMYGKPGSSCHVDADAIEFDFME